MTDSNFFLGKWIDSNQPASYDPVDLTTHAIVVGMTGSGKTGLLIALLEEAARKGLPAIIIDPKGDLTNLLLHFPELRPADFAPWLDPETAKRQSLTVDQLAEKTAARWSEGLAKWGLGKEDVLQLSEAVDYTIYSPGSTAGEPVNLLSSFQAPANWDTNREGERERIASTVTALLGLVGMENVDPLRSREHILLSNILENAWSQGKSLDLAGLIEGVTTPPFDRLGAFPLERFFPEKDRFDLALLLNNFLASPSFQTWLEGQPLDIARMLYTPEGKPRFSIFYLAHLSESERMFFVTLLLAAVEGWMRGQRGSSGLRALLAFDEIVGYLPPVANPPSRPVLLRLLKQARAFGLGLMLSTQNPSDLNYKALSNAGTWFIGRLQTEQDKNRLLDGLQSLDSGIDRAAFDQLIARVGPRLFLLHNVYQPGPQIFESRWVMNYLAGPLTRAQLPALKKAPVSSAGNVQVMDRGQPNINAAEVSVPPVIVAQLPVPSDAAPAKQTAQEIPAAPVVAPATPSNGPAKNGQTDRNVGPHPALSAGIQEYFFPVSLNINRALATQGPALKGPLEPLGLVYRPALMAQAGIRYLARKYEVDTTRALACLLINGDPRPDWDQFARPPFDPAILKDQPEAGFQFFSLPGEWSTAKNLTALQKDFLDWAYRMGTIYVRANETLKVYAGPDVAEEEFRRRVAYAAREGMTAQADKAAAAYDAKLETLKRKIERQQAVIDRREDEVGQRKAEQTSNDFELLTSVFTGRKKSLTTSFTKRRMTQQAQGELQEAKKILENLQDEWKSLSKQRQDEVDRIQENWRDQAGQITQVPINPLKKDVYLDLFGIAWLPYYQVKNPDGIIYAAAY